jgi:hypothetical protein
VRVSLKLEYGQSEEEKKKRFRRVLVDGSFYFEVLEL